MCVCARLRMENDVDDNNSTNIRIRTQNIKRMEIMGSRWYITLKWFVQFEENTWLTHKWIEFV